MKKSLKDMNEAHEDERRGKQNTITEGVNTQMRGGGTLGSKS